MDQSAYPTARAMAAIFDQHRSSVRKRLLEFLGTISREDFVRPVPEAAGKSIRDILVHSVSASGFWISLLQNRGHDRLDPASYPNIEAVLPVIEEVSDRVHHVLTNAEEAWFVRKAVFSLPSSKTMEELVPAWVAVHMLTHEYHHKGQIVTIARMMGYEPPETDFL